jgi:hypothetical protein
MISNRIFPKLTLFHVAIAASAASALGVLFCAFVLPPTRATAGLSALGALTLGLLREAIRGDRAFTDAKNGRGAWLSAAEALRRIRKEEDEKLWGRDGFPCGSFEFPLIACPRAEFELSLARHEALVRTHLPALLFLARKNEKSTWREPLDWIFMCAGEIDATRAPQPPRVSVHNRVDLERRFHDFLVVERGLSRGPGRACLPVAVVDEDIVSVWKLDLRTVRLDGGRVQRELVLEREVLAFEPLRHHVERNGSACIRQWQATATAPVHEERFELQPAAATEEEYIDRLFAVAEPELRQVAASAEAQGRGVEQLLLMACARGEHGGANALVYSARRSGWLEEIERYPKFNAIVDRPWPPGWVPVLVANRAFAGIRWVAVHEDAAPEARPDAATDYPRWSTRRAVRQA